VLPPHTRKVDTMAKRHPIDLKLSGVAGAAGTVTLETHDFRGGGLLCVQRVTVRVPGQDACYVNVSFVRHGQKLYIGPIAPVQEGIAATMTGATFAPSDYGVAIDFSGLAAGKVVEAYIFGYWTSFPE